MASPAASAPKIIGTGFSRRNNSVRSRVEPVLPRICSRRRRGGSKTLGARRRRLRGGAFCSAPKGSSFTKSSSVGSITNDSHLRGRARWSKLLQFYTLQQLLVRPQN